MFSVEEDRCRGVGKSDFYQIVEKLFFRLVKKVSVARRAKNRSFGYAQDRPSAGVFMWYVGARRSSATKQMSLFQQPVYDLTIRKTMER